MKMPNLPQGVKCCGCSACFSACVREAISLLPDEEGFLHPVIDGAKCIGCGACEHACPEMNGAGEKHMPLAVYAARSKDRTLRKASSSGGLFTLLSRVVLKSGGVVFGVKCDMDDGGVRFVKAMNEDELAPMRGSKYVQAEVGNVFRQIKELLASGQKVMFSGTPCQVAGLKTYLGHDYENLLTMDFVCHGVASPLAWHSYLKSTCGGCARPGFSEIKFRDKRAGWRRYAMSLVSEDGRQHCSRFKGYVFLWGFIADLYNRPSCYACRFRDGKNKSDIVVGDYWGVEDRFPGMDDDTGTSLVIVRTGKGAEWFAKLQDADFQCSDWTHAASCNPSLVGDDQPHERRSDFFTALRQGRRFDETVRDLLQMSFGRRIVGLLKRKLGL